MAKKSTSAASDRMSESKQVKKANEPPKFYGKKSSPEEIKRKASFIKQNSVSVYLKDAQKENLAYAKEYYGSLSSYINHLIEEDLEVNGETYKKNHLHPVNPKHNKK